MKSILIVDDEKNIREGLQKALTLEGFYSLTAENGLAALDVLKKHDIDLLLTDLKMPGLTGDELLKEALILKPQLQIIVMTGHGTVENAVQAMQNGAYDFLTKPLNLDHLFLIINRALKTRALEEENQLLENQLKQKKQKGFRSFSGESPAMQEVLRILNQAAPTKAGILILGESGVGKELAAEILHSLSPRKNRPLIKVNCAALSENLLESELFGHEKGAFTGAIARRKGRFELADGGDIFLDEIGEISQAMQVKLLRVLQERCFERVGGEETITVDVRLIAATNKNLEAEIEQGRFREDLYYRLNVVQVVIPPLRERKEDIEPLALQFLHEFSEENGRNLTGFSHNALNALKHYRWPGNIRQLRNCIESAVVMAGGPHIQSNDLPGYVVTNRDTAGELKFSLNLSLAEVEQRYIDAVLLSENGNKSRAAKRLGLSRKTLQRKTGENND